MELGNVYELVAGKVFRSDLPGIRFAEIIDLYFRSGKIVILAKCYLSNLSTCPVEYTPEEFKAYFKYCRMEG